MQSFKDLTKTRTALLLGVFACLTLGCILILFNLMSRGSTMTPVSYNLLQKNWTRVPGTEMVNGGLRIIPLNRAIVAQDGSGGQPNPPVGVLGPHLKVSGDFEIDTHLANTEGETSIQIYGAVPVIYDEWRLERSSLRLSLSQDRLKIEIWDGSRQKPAQSLSFPVSSGLSPHIKLAFHSKNVSLYADDVKLGSFGSHNLLDAHRLWFGFDASGKDWVLTALRASVINKSALVVDSPAIPKAKYVKIKNSLRELASKQKRPFYIGAALALSPLATDNSYANLALSQFNMVTTENELKPQFVHPQPNLYSFTDADNLVDIAKTNDISVHGHTLVFGEANPRWMQETPLANRQKIMLDHINQVVGHFKGRLASWDVVNEPLSDEDKDYAGDGLRHHIWYQAMGETYIDLAFRAAHAADPNAKLYLNDYGLEADGERWDALIDLVTRLQARGVPIDGIGFQAHVYEKGDHVDGTVLRRHMKQLAEMGLLARISEIDVHGDNAEVQAEQYKTVLAACLAEPNCTAYSTWGVTDRYGSTTEAYTYPPQFGDDLIWNANYHAKSVLARLKQTFLSNL